MVEQDMTDVKKYFEQAVREMAEAEKARGNGEHDEQKQREEYLKKINAVIFVLGHEIKTLEKFLDALAKIVEVVFRGREIGNFQQPTEGTLTYVMDVTDKLFTRAGKKLGPRFFSHDNESEITSVGKGITKFGNEIHHCMKEKKFPDDIQRIIDHANEHGKRIDEREVSQGLSSWMNERINHYDILFWSREALTRLKREKKVHQERRDRELEKVA